MKFKNKFLDRYIEEAPLPLALERVFECLILSQRSFKKPILDIGCGDGIFAQCLFDESVDVGIDSNRSEIDRAKERNAYTDLICCSGDRIPKEDGQFRTIFSNSVLEHIPDIESVLRECRRLIHQDGRMYITVPTHRFDQYTVFYQVSLFLGLKGLAQRFSRAFNSFWNHEHYYDVNGWESLFKRCGFSVSDMREYNPKFNCVLNDFLVSFSLLAFLNRKFLKRWFFMPKFRKVYAKILSAGFRRVVSDNIKKDQDCGLVFFELKKYMD